jgi:hypothetical protein
VIDPESWVSAMPWSWTKSLELQNKLTESSLLRIADQDGIDPEPVLAQNGAKVSWNSRQDRAGNNLLNNRLGQNGQQQVEAVISDHWDGKLREIQRCGIVTWPSSDVGCPTGRN